MKAESIIKFTTINNGTEDEILIFEIECINEEVALNFSRTMFELYEEVVCILCDEFIKGQVLTEGFPEWWKKEIDFRVLEIE